MVEYQTKIYGQNNTKVIFVFGGLGSNQKLFWFLGKALSSSGYKAVVYTFPLSLLSPNPEKTRKNIVTIVQDVRKSIRKLPKRQQKELSVFGTSIGTIPAMMLANQERNVENIILNSPIVNLTETVWKWEKGHFNFKKQLQKRGITRKKLRTEWFELDLLNNLDTLTDKRILLYASEHDEIIPYNQIKILIKRLEEEEISFEAIINSRHKHLVSSLISILRFPTYISFLQEETRK